MSVAKDPKMQHLKQRGGRAGTWYLNHPIPKDLQPKYLTGNGKPKTHLVRALGTGDPGEAYRRKVSLLPSILAEFDQKKREARGIMSSELVQAFAFRKELRDADNADNYELSSTLATVITDAAERIHRDGHESAEALKKARAFVRIAEGEETLSEAFEDWLTKGTLPDRTRLKYGTALTEFTSFVGGHPLVSDMN